ncbi:JAB domain-containing protein [Pedobacter sp. SYSU D00535]|uniref:JAB domain-containing protein n=1 Tax=Pedobacter sp. SYSU D00535 TaxID=2810308 RepID=UPI001A96E88D|nr:JAB domain-containing protein [Pedobacter sp. SYSU D00535]
MKKHQVTNELFQVAEVRISYCPRIKAKDRLQVNSSNECMNIFRKAWDQDLIEYQEEFKAMFLNRGNRVIGIYSVSKGGTAGTVADPKLIFAAALKASASSIILCHNHPSGNLKPSQADINLTRKLKDGANLLEISVLDHIILTMFDYFSFADEGLL